MSMATNLGRMIPYLERLLPMLLDLLITWSWEIRGQTKTAVSTTIMPVATKLGRMVIYLERLLPIKSHDHIITLSREITWETKNISLLPQCLWSQNLAGGGGGGLRRGWYPNAHCELLLIKSHNHIITWSWETTWQTKNTSPLPQYLWSQNLAQWWLTLSGFLPIKSHGHIIT